LSDEIIGRVIGTDPAGPLDYFVSVADGQYIEMDDVVTLTHTVPERGEVTMYGLVTDVRAHQEGASEHYDVHRIVDGLVAHSHNVAKVMTTRIVPEVFVPPQPGTGVVRAEGTAKDAALFMDTVDDDRKLPAGFARTGGILSIDADFLDGSSGAHINISGVSGIATKTSYALFLLHNLLHPSSKVLGVHQKSARGLIFNVKGQDLLYLDQANTKLDDTQRAQWAEMGMEPGPFRSVALWSPPNPRSALPQPSSERTQGVKAYWWSIADFCAERMLGLLFADADDERQQYVAVARMVENQLERHATPLDGGGVQIGSEKIVSFPQLVDYIAEETEGAMDHAWVGSNTAGSVSAFVRRLQSSIEHVGHLIRGDDDTWKDHKVQVMDGNAQMVVVDINPLSGRAQRFVVGATLRQEFAAKEARSARHPLLFVVLDELNKYAPRQGNSPIKSTLTEIAERGRSLGIILIGAQQTASAVAEPIITNAAIKISGRLDAAEAEKAEYKWMPREHRDRARLLTPGSMILSQPRLPAPMIVGFPMPGWATRGDEAEKVLQTAAQVNSRLVGLTPDHDLDDDDVVPVPVPDRTPAPADTDVTPDLPF
jgi:uncharacterized protein